MRPLAWDCGSRHTRKNRLDVPVQKSSSGAAKIMETCLGLFFSHVFCNHIPHAESVILHFSKRSVEEVLRPRSNTFLQKTLFFQKKRFCFCFLRLVDIYIAVSPLGARLGGAFLDIYIAVSICNNLRNLAH